MFCIQHASLLKPKYVFSLPLAFPPKRNRVDAALSLEAATLLLRIFTRRIALVNQLQHAKAFAAAHVAPSSIVLWDVPVDGSCFFELEWLLANPTRWKGALGHGHSSSGQLTSHAILYPIIGVKYQEPVRHVTCRSLEKYAHVCNVWRLSGPLALPKALRPPIAWTEVQQVHHGTSMSTFGIRESFEFWRWPKPRVFDLEMR